METTLRLCRMSDKIEGIQTEDNRVKAATAFIDMDRGACGRVVVGSLIQSPWTSTHATMHFYEVKIVALVRRLQTAAHHL